MNNRRKLLIALGAASLTPRTLLAQVKPPILIGWLSFTSRESGARWLDALKEGLAALGWKEGAQVRIDARWADGRDDRVASITQELSAQKPGLIVAQGLRTAISAAKAAPKIPMVMVTNNDPVAAGLVTSLARPGGMITGLAGFAVELIGKHLELLLAVAPKVKRVGFLAPLTAPNRAELLEVARRSATRYAVEAHFAEAGNPEDIEPSMSRLAKEGAQGLVVMPGGLFAIERRRIVRLASTQRWPVIAGPRSWAEEGALLSYGATDDQVASHRRAAYFVDRILKGAKPGDIPIEQPTTFEFIVNLRTAKVLGLMMPPEIMVRATRVIE